MIKKTITLFLAAAIFSACGGEKSEKASAEKKNITIKGSDTMLPLSQREAETFMKGDSLTSLQVTGGGSGVGIKALLEGTTDIAMASRDMKMDERTQLEQAKKELRETVVAYDALAVIVNPSNSVTKLTREQLEGIFTGEIKNWKEVGGDDMPIVVYSRESSSGTYEFFKEHVMGKKNYAATVLGSASNGAITQSVAQTKGAIGYVGLAYLNNTTKAVDVSYDKGATFVTPSVEGAKSKVYPIARPLYYFYLASSEEKVKPFLDYILSAEGQKVATDEGYVPVK